MVSLCFTIKKNHYRNKPVIKSLSIRAPIISNHADTDEKNRLAARYNCVKALLTIEAAVVLPFFLCFMVFILYFFRVLQVQAGVSQALQYAGRRTAAEYHIQASDDSSDKGSDLLGLVRAKLLFEKQLKKQDCPVQYIHHGMAGIHFIQSDFSGHYVELKVIYQMNLPITLFGNIQYRIVQEAKCRKWTGFEPGQDNEETDTWLYYTEHGTVYHASRTCTHLDLSIRGVSYAQAGNSRNKSGGKYYPCEKCKNAASMHSMVYITDYGDRFHSSLTCSGLKRSIYMIRKSKATEKRMCSKCGHSQTKTSE